MSNIHEKNTKIKEFVKKHGIDILCGAGMLFSITTLCYACGYKAGARDTQASITRGIEKMWNANPGLEETMWNALTITTAKEVSKT